MTSRVNQVNRGIEYKQTQTLVKRFLFTILVFCVQAVYYPTSNRLFGGIEPKLPIDIFPLWAVWVLPYVLCYPLWWAGFGWAIFKFNDAQFRSFITAFLVTCTIAAITFIVFPTYVRAATIHGSDVFSSLLRFIHQEWGRYDAFPSGHVYITVLLALFFNLWYPQHKFYWILIPSLVSLSTLFTHQHYVADIVGGLVVALIGFHMGLRWSGSLPQPEQSTKTRLLRPPS